MFISSISAGIKICYTVSYHCKIYLIRLKKGTCFFSLWCSIKLNETDIHSANCTYECRVVISFISISLNRSTNHFCDKIIHRKVQPLRRESSPRKTKSLHRIFLLNVYDPLQTLPICVYTTKGGSNKIGRTFR